MPFITDAHVGKQSAKKLQAVTPVQIQERWNLSWEAWQFEIDKFTLTEKWYRAYEKHIRVGEDWRDSFRFPELFGAIRRKYDNLIEFLPEVKIKGDGDGVIALQSAYEHQARVSNLQREKQRAMLDAVKTGTGCLFCAPTRNERTVKGDKGKPEQRLLYDGLAAERIDPRDLIPAYSSLIMHDHTGQQACPYVFRRRIYYYDTFNHKYSGAEYKNLDKVVGMSSYEGAFTGDRTLTNREGIEKESGRYVTVLEYWDQENDILRVYANNFNTIIYESPNGIPYQHKQLPFHFYYNYRREDSIAGVGEIELRQSYNLFREAVLNLMIDNLKLELQPAYIIDGDINFNTEETELEPGAIFTVRGIDGGKLQDSIMPFRAGGITSDVPTIINTIEDSMISSTGDDTRALYASPDQLATQTLAKREALQKRIRANIQENTVDTEFYLANQIASYLQYELAKPYKEKGGKTTHRRIQIQGYEAIQDKKESGVEFEKLYGSKSDFYLNKEVVKDFDQYEIEIIPAKLDEEIKRDQTEKLILFMQQVMNTAQLDPTLLEGLDIPEFLKEMSKNLGLDVGKIFPPVDKDMDELDVINTEHDQIAMGVVPDIKPEEDSMDHYMKHVEFEQSSVFKKLNKKARDAMKKHKLLTLQNVQIQKASAGQPQQGGLAGAPQAVQPQPVQGVAGPPGGQAPPGRAGISPQTVREGLRAGQSVRPA
jgi:hypothetical protein